MNDLLGITLTDPRVLAYLGTQDRWIQKIRLLKEQFSFSKPVEVMLFDGTEELGCYLGMEVPNWVTGTYSDGRILMLDYPAWVDKRSGEFGQIVVHELTHVIVNDRTASRCPLWLHEGLALHFAEQTASMWIEEDCFSKEDAYQLDYGDEHLYNLCGALIDSLIGTYGLKAILSKLSPKTNFQEDDWLGVEAMKGVIRQLKQSVTGGAISTCHLP
ncbi:hypothetical protein [Gorillibacterium sp. CAU 1737]|uniref:hypothetical protein n=1 Tax=Gorillibacterium sp. CAU 1737 TaxID=3140362 RepID=UPI003261A52E